MKKRTGLVTLAIGDGGNDVIMIQSSDVGVGIVGKEGQQAARAADYVLSEFKHLKRLCCVHGVDSVSRSWTISNYSFYKSIMFCVLQTSYAAFSSYSGVSLFNSMQVTLYNIFLFLPIVSMVTKRGYDEADLLSRPALYRYYNDSDPSNKQTLFSSREFLCWLGMGVAQALIVSFVGALIEATGTYDSFTNTIFFANLLAQDVIIFLLLPNVTWLNFGAVLLCHVLMWLVCFVCSSVKAFSGFVPYMSMQ